MRATTCRLFIYGKIFPTFTDTFNVVLFASVFQFPTHLRSMTMGGGGGGASSVIGSSGIEDRA